MVPDLDGTVEVECGEVGDGVVLGCFDCWFDGVDAMIVRLDILSFGVVAAGELLDCA